MREITFIHAADLHLDSTLTGMEQRLSGSIIERIKESSFLSLRKIVDKAIGEQVDFILFAGDIYDSEHRSIRAEIKFKKEMERLDKEGIQAFIIHGNHDFLTLKNNHVELPKNVHVFDTKVTAKPFEKNGELLAYIYGFSYGNRSVTENITGDYEKKIGATYHIGMLHGSVEQSADHDNYAPFQVSQLQEKGFNYWALGHIHKRTQLSENPPIIYSGNTQGRHKKELGEKGAYLVRLWEVGAEYEFFPTNDITWKTVEMNMTGVDNWADLLRSSIQLLDKERGEQTGTFLMVTFQGESSLLKNQGETDEFLATLMESEEERENFVWIVSYKDETFEEIAVRENSFLGEVLTFARTTDNISELLTPLTETPFARKVGMNFSQEEEQEIQKEAERLLLHFFKQAGER